MKNWVAFLLIAIGTGCGSTSKNVSAQTVTSSSPESSRDELLDPNGKWDEHKAHTHITVMPKQFAKWKKIAPEMHTWCVNFKAKECEEYYEVDNSTTAPKDFRNLIRVKVDPACLLGFTHGWAYGANDCAGNYIEYQESETADAFWVKGERDPKSYYKYTAEGKWMCPDGFAANYGGFAGNNMPDIWYVPPKIYCSRQFYWGVWRRSPYAKGGAQ